MSLALSTIVHLLILNNSALSDWSKPRVHLESGTQSIRCTFSTISQFTNSIPTSLNPSPISILSSKEPEETKYQEPIKNPSLIQEIKEAIQGKTENTLKKEQAAPFPLSIEENTKNTRENKIKIEETHLIHDKNPPLLEKLDKAQTVHEPYIIISPAPKYPRIYERFGQEGSVKLFVAIDASGKPQKVKIISSSGYPLLDNEAQKTILNRWNFNPAKMNGIEIPGSQIVEIHFSLQKTQ